MTQNINDVLQAPTWQMADAYGDVDATRYRQSFDALSRLVEKLELSMSDTCPREKISPTLSLYEEAVTLSSSLASFLKCLGAKDSTDSRIADENSSLLSLSARLNQAGMPLFEAMYALEKEDELWQHKPLSHWKFVVQERSQDWHEKLSPEDRAWLSTFETRNFHPLGDVFKMLQKGVDFEAINAKGEKERIRAAKLIAVIKGAPDRVLRESVNSGMNKSYAARAELYASLLNQLHGFRLTVFERANVTPLSVSLAQNRMSEAALNAMLEAIRSRITDIRECVTIRAPFFGTDKLAVYDLMAPAPKGALGDKADSVPALIPYEEGIQTVKDALCSVNPKMAEFIDMMLQKNWVEAVVDDKKIGGAFYSRFNELKQPRVFSTYMGSITAVLQQSHELGHALHYWMMRDMPMIETEFPMTLTETASTFNEAAVRRHLVATSASEEDRFNILWQDLRSAANFLLNTTVRLDFELEFLKARAKGYVSAQKAVELMRTAWHKWYGDTTQGADDYLWAYKLHYYKTDQLIYNYPYTVGYLLSQGLIVELDRRGDDFFEFYRNMLRDTGRMTVDEIVAKHFNADATNPEFWRRCIEGPLASLRTFKKDFVK